MWRIASSPICRINDLNKYSRQSFENRCRVRNPDGWQWLTIPLQKLSLGTPVRNVLLEADPGWRKRHLKGLRYNYSTSPYYEYYSDDLTELIDSPSESLAELTIASMKWTHKVLGIASSMHILSDSHEVDVTHYASELYHHPEYRQNFKGFFTGMSSLDLLFNHGPDSLNILLNGNQS